MIGQIVCSKSGRDKGYFLVIIGEDDKFLYVADGKERPLEKPKRKNPKHLVFTNTVLEENSFKTNKSLRKTLAVFRDCRVKEEDQNV